MKSVFVLLIMAIILNSLSLQPIFGQVKDEFGTISDLAVDETKWYYFEIQKGITSTVWIADTRIGVADDKTTQYLSEKLFIYPTELVQDREQLYFTALSEDCEGQIFCDYQDLYKMSKNNGSSSTLTKNLKSSVHLSIADDAVYASESSGNIWKVSKTDGSKKLMIKANEIIMDLAVSDGKIYWIEELSDQNNDILTLDNGQSKIIAKNLKIPYDLTIQKDTLYWNEIQVKPHQFGFSEFTAIRSHDGENSINMEFQNTSPISTASNETHYKPYLVFDNYVFLVNNTDDVSTIHMINLYNSTKHDVGVISGYDAKYLRTDGKTLFVIGNNQDGFVIDRHSLPVVVPEFPITLMGVMFFAIVSVIIFSRFSHSLSR